MPLEFKRKLKFMSGLNFKNILKPKIVEFKQFKYRSISYFEHFQLKFFKLK